MQRNSSSSVTVCVSVCFVPADRTHVSYSFSGAAAAGLFPHAAGVALRLHGFSGTFGVCDRASVVVEEVGLCESTHVLLRLVGLDRNV